MPAEARFVDVTVGDGFVCGIVDGPETSIRCFGDEPADAAVTTAPRGGSYDVVETCGRRSYALSMSGGIRVRGAGIGPGWLVRAAHQRHHPLLRCRRDRAAGQARGRQYVSVKAAARGGLVFDRVMPGLCAPMSSCRCGVLPGSANLCAGGLCVCVDCAFELNVAPPPPGRQKQSGGSGRRTMWIGIVVAGGSVVLLVAALQVALHLWGRRRKKLLLGWGRSKGPGSVVEHLSIDALAAATDGFCDARRIRSGSFGSVYRGTLPSGRDVAIKRAEDGAVTRATTSTAARRTRDRETAFASELTAWLAPTTRTSCACWATAPTRASAC
jgi:hypothetical protein